MLYVRIAKFFLRRHTSRTFVEKEGRYDFCITNLEEQSLLRGVSGTAVMLLRAAHRSVISPEQPENGFFANSFCNAASRYVSAINSIFTLLVTPARDRSLKHQYGATRFSSANFWGRKPNPFWFWMYMLANCKSLSSMLEKSSRRLRSERYLGEKMYISH